MLIVDDEEALRHAMVFDFKRRGFQVLDASNGRDALEIVKKGKIDIVLTDVRMHGGDGVELLKKIKELSPELPVVMFITGYADMTTEEAYDEGAVASFAKPFDRKALMAAVMRAITTREELWSENRSKDVEVEFRIDLRFPELNAAIQTRALNLGRGGLFVACPGPFPKISSRATFSIHFERGSPRAIEGNGIVRWIRTEESESHPTGYGVEFESLSDSSRQAVIDQIKSLNMLAFIPRC